MPIIGERERANLVMSTVWWLWWPTGIFATFTLHTILYGGPQVYLYGGPQVYLRLLPFTRYSIYGMTDN